MPFNLFSRKPADPVEELTQRLQKNPRDVVALMERSDIYMTRRDPQSALKDVERALQISLVEPKLDGETRAILLGKLYTIQSRALAGMGNWSGALVAADRALEQTPDDEGTLLQHGVVLRESGKLQEAIAEFDKVLALNKDSAYAYTARGIAYYSLEKHDNALADYDAAIALQKDYAVTWSNRGNVFLKRNDFAQAADNYRTAINLDRNLLQAYDNLAVALMELKQPDAAIKAINDGLSVHPNSAPLLTRAGEIYSTLKQYPQALNYLDQSLVAQPDHTDTLLMRGQIYYRLRNFPAAIADLEHAASREPDRAETYFNLSLVHFQAGNRAAAETTIGKVLVLTPDDEEAKQFLAKIQKGFPGNQHGLSAQAALAMGNDALAFSEWDRTIEEARKAGDNETASELLIMAGSHHIKRGQQATGDSYVRLGMDLAEQSHRLDLVAQANVELGYVAFSQQRLNEAKSHFLQVQELGEKINSKRYIHLGVGNVGAVLAAAKQNQQAIPLLEKARQIAREIGEKTEEANYCMNLGVIYLNIPDPFKAIAAFEQMQQLRAELGQPPDPKIAQMVDKIKAIMKP
jgi:tetratricopeptide (TPR) repeat protein